MTTPMARERAIREVVRLRAMDRGLEYTSDLIYGAQCHALDCHQLHGDSAVRAIRRADEWLDVMTGKRRHVIGPDRNPTCKVDSH